MYAYPLMNNEGQQPRYLYVSTYVITEVNYMDLR